MRLSVVIPVYNEVDTLESVVHAVRDCGVPDAQIVVVDDCSSDGTVELLKSELSDKIDVIAYHEENRGKGAALRTGINAAKGESIVFQDADLEYNPKDIARMLQIKEETGCDVVYGSRFLGKGYSEVSPAWHHFINDLLTRFSNLFTGYPLTDMETCYKLFPRSFLQSISIDENQFGIEPELTAKAAGAGLSLVETPIDYDRRGFEEGKKIRAKDGFRALYVIARYAVSETPSFKT